jgi:hypothetical protein
VGGSGYNRGLSKEAPRQFFAAPVEAGPHRTPEWRLQAAVVSDWHKLQDDGWEFEFAGDMGGLHTSKSQAGKAILTGMKAGEPDLRVYLKSGKVALLELKAKGGRLRRDQIDRHARLAALGHKVVVIQADDEDAMVTACRAFLMGLGIERKGTVH